MPQKNRSALNLEQRIEVIRKLEKDRLIGRKIAEFCFGCLSILGGIVINKINHTV